MNLIRLLLPRLLSLALLPLALSAATFEGTIDMTVKQDGNTHSVSYATKDGKLRITMAAGPMGEAVALFNLAEKQLLMLMPQQNMYMVMPVAEQLEDAGVTDPNAGSRLQKTSETETILGYQCTKYIYADKNEPVEIWATDQLGQFVSMPSGNPMQQGRGKSGWDSAIKGDFFPMRVVSTDKRGREAMRWEVTAVQPQKLDDSLFEVPAGYRKFDMGGLMQGLGGLRGKN